MSGFKNYHRRSIRMRGYDYSLEGAYFITICTYQRLNLFGEVMNGAMQLNPYGIIVGEQWVRLEKRFPQSIFEHYMIMPNHIHGIIHIVKGAGEEFEQVISRIPPQRPYSDKAVIPPALGVIVRAYKASVSYRINAVRGVTKPPVWQRNYYDHIVRNKQELNQIWNYIDINPQSWFEDQLNPSNQA
jgi:putative transposase